MLPTLRITTAGSEATQATVRHTSPRNAAVVVAAGGVCPGMNVYRRAYATWSLCSRRWLSVPGLRTLEGC